MLLLTLTLGAKNRKGKIIIIIIIKIERKWKRTKSTSCNSDILWKSKKMYKEKFNNISR